MVNGWGGPAQQQQLKGFSLPPVLPAGERRSMQSHPDGWGRRDRGGSISKGGNIFAGKLLPHCTVSLSLPLGTCRGNYCVNWSFQGEKKTQKASLWQWFYETGWLVSLLFISFFSYSGMVVFVLSYVIIQHPLETYSFSNEMGRGWILVVRRNWEEQREGKLQSG